MCIVGPLSIQRMGPLIHVERRSHLTHAGKGEARENTHGVRTLAPTSPYQVEGIPVHIYVHIYTRIDIDIYISIYVYIYRTS
jgi:hypothetical protein